MPDGDTILVAAFYTSTINALCFIAFAWDKHCARTGKWRIPEYKLLALAAAGGIFGAVAAQWLLRHKTWKQPFRTYLHLIAALQVIFIAALSFPEVRSALSIFLQQLFVET